MGWTATNRPSPLARQWLRQKWQTSLGNTRLYDLFGEPGLSHQKAHRDYGAGGAAGRLCGGAKKLGEAGPDTAVVAFDEFALLSTTHCHYAWAEENTAPKVPSNEKGRQKLCGFLSADLRSGKTTADFQPQAKAENVVLAIAMVDLRHAALGFRRVVLVLDNCRIHGKAMKTGLAELLAETALAQGVAVKFLHAPVYSPDFNPAEYLSHLVRKNSLYHLPCCLDVWGRAERIRGHLAQGPPQMPEQMANILQHIYGLLKNGWS